MKCSACVAVESCVASVRPLDTWELFYF